VPKSGDRMDWPMPGGTRVRAQILRDLLLWDRIYQRLESQEFGLPSRDPCIKLEGEYSNCQTGGCSS